MHLGLFDILHTVCELKLRYIITESLAALDIYVISTLQQLTLCGAANSIGYALSVG